jgi:hypothetical protein
MGLFVRTCTAMQLEGFNPQDLSNVIQGESRVEVCYVCDCLGR